MAGLQCPDHSPRPAVLVINCKARRGPDPAISFHWPMLSGDVLCLHFKTRAARSLPSPQLFIPLTVLTFYSPHDLLLSLCHYSCLVTPHLHWVGCNWYSWKRGIRCDCGIPDISASNLSLSYGDKGKDKMPSNLGLAKHSLQTEAEDLISQAGPTGLRARTQTSQLVQSWTISSTPVLVLLISWSQVSHFRKLILQSKSTAARVHL